MSIRKGVTYSSTGEMISCLFCSIVAGTEPSTIVAENTRYLVFKNIRPVSDVAHYLVSPKEHIQNLTDVKGKSGATIIEEMLQIGRESLGDQAETAQYSFHVPPFNSIDHLHLHCIAAPQDMTWINWLKYSPSFPWCSAVDDVLTKLREEEEED